MWGLFHEPWSKDPASLNNQDSMERRSFFFFVAQVAAFCFSKWPVFLLGEETNKKSREKQNKRPIFSNTPISFKPNTFQNTVCFSIWNVKRKCHEIPKLWTHQDLAWIDRGLWRMSGPGCLWMEAMYRVRFHDAIRMSPWRMQCRTDRFSGKFAVAKKKLWKCHVSCWAFHYKSYGSVKS